MKTNVCKHIGRLAVMAGLASAIQVSATTLPVPYYAQRSFFAVGDTNHNLSQWCWNACSEMVMNTPMSASYPGTFFTQDAIAAYGSEGSNYWNWIWGSSPRSTNAVTGAIQPALNGIDLVLKHFASLTTRKYSRALSTDELQTEIDAGRPCIARLGWCTLPAGTAYVNNGGGHFVVLYGFDGTTVDINDPWPDNGPLMQTYATFSPAAGSTYANTGHSRFKWTHTLTLGAGLDVCFLIDTTGSMSGTINSVKSSAITIASNIFALFPDARIAVKDYKDMPEPLYNNGDSSYLDEIDSPFSTNRSAIANAVNPLVATGGGDTPEALFSSLLYTINNTSWSGGSLGGWRTNPTPRIIIVATDAPGHNPAEPWAGGHSLNEVITKATQPGKEISIFGLWVGSSSSALADLTALAYGTGGAALSGGAGGSGVVSAILDVINQTADSTRKPQGTVSSPRPKFNFELGQIGMAGVPNKYVIQILKSNEVTGEWTLFLEKPVSGSSYTPTVPLPQGFYRWRLGAQQPATTILSPSGIALSSVSSAIIYENEYTEFERITALPEPATIISPDAQFSMSLKDVPILKRKLFAAGRLPIPFTFATGLNATSYRVTIEVQTRRGWKTFKTLTVAPPFNNPNAETLTVTVKGIKPGTYRWSVESLNPDVIASKKAR